MPVNATESALPHSLSVKAQPAPLVSWMERHHTAEHAPSEIIKHTQTGALKPYSLVYPLNVN